MARRSRRWCARKILVGLVVAGAALYLLLSIGLYASGSGAIACLPSSALSFFDFPDGYGTLCADDAAGCENLCAERSWSAQIKRRRHRRCEPPTTCWR